MAIQVRKKGKNARQLEHPVVESAAELARILVVVSSVLEANFNILTLLRIEPLAQGTGLIYFWVP